MNPIAENFKIFRTGKVQQQSGVFDFTRGMRFPTPTLYYEYRLYEYRLEAKLGVTLNISEEARSDPVCMRALEEQALQKVTYAVYGKYIKQLSDLRIALLAKNERELAGQITNIISDIKEPFTND